MFSPDIHLKYQLHIAHTIVHKDFRFHSFPYHMGFMKLYIHAVYGFLLKNTFQLDFSIRKAITEVMTCWILMNESGNPSKQIVLTEQNCCNQRYG
ncbi:MAG TPA: hypothetical protein DCW34_01915 [Erysipelotrichaceae bacterium]|nr:hypothetical protein [Erysipelotrichaceae bacterium]